MDSESRKHRRRSKHRGASDSRRSSGRKRRSSSTAKASSSFSAAAVTPSRAPVELRLQKSDPPISAQYLWALLGVCVLILLGGGHHVGALGFALILPGLSLLLRPPTRSMGKWMDFGILGLLVVFCCAFLPLFYWSAPEWRSTAVEVLGIDLPSVLSVQPRISFEALLMAVAGFGWFYAAGNWDINYAGRRRLYFILSCVVAVFSAVIIWGNLYFIRYPGAEDATAFSFFPNRNQTSNFIAIGGVLAFGYAMEGLRSRKLSHAIGLFASFLAVGALLYGGALSGVFLYFGGVLFWFLASLRRSVVSLFLKVGLPLTFVIFSFYISGHEAGEEPVVGQLSSPSSLVEDYNMRIYRDTLGMIKDAPLTGVGLGNFSAVFPQYSDLSRSHQHAEHPQNDVFWLWAEGGTVGLLFFTIFLVGYIGKCLASLNGRSQAYRIIALTGVVMFLVHGLFDVSGHRPGTAYFAIMCAALALPRETILKSTLRPVVWRTVGGFLVFFGGLWIVGGLFELPTHSNVISRIQEERAAESRLEDDVELLAQTVDAMIESKPLAWSGYFQRAQLGLSRGDLKTEVAQDFRRARFVEPNAAVVAYEEGQAWLAYDQTRAVSAWGEALMRYTDSKRRLFDRIMQHGDRDGTLMLALVDMCRGNREYRADALLYLKPAVFNRVLLDELAEDPSLESYTKKKRTALVGRWVESGEVEQVEAYLDQYGKTLHEPWLLYAQIQVDQYRFEEAVAIVRDALPVPEIPEVLVDRSRIDRLKREFFVSSNDLAKGTALTDHFIEVGDSREALRVLDVLYQKVDAPAYIYYWRAEVLYQLKDFSESWHAFEAYLEHR